LRIAKPRNDIHGHADDPFDPEVDHIKEFFLVVGSDSTFAHSTTILAKESEVVNGKMSHDTKIDIGNKSFIGIATELGSGTVVGNNTSVWFECRIGFDVKIGNNSIIGMASEINDDVTIPDNCLVPNHAHIQASFEIIPYEEYKQRREELDKQSTPNFIIQFSTKGKEDISTSMEIQENYPHEIELKEIGSDYPTMATFNTNVVAENRKFAEVKSFMSILQKEIPELDLIQTEILIFNDQEKETIRERCKGIISNTLLDMAFNKDGTSITYEKYPRDIDDFLSNKIPQFIKLIKRSDKAGIIKLAESCFISPKVDTSTILLGENIFTGNIQITQNSFCYNTKIRCDELKEEQRCMIENSNLYRVVIHGGRDKEIFATQIFDTTIHGRQILINSQIGRM